MSIEIKSFRRRQRTKWILSEQRTLHLFGCIVTVDDFSSKHCLHLFCQVLRRKEESNRFFILQQKSKNRIEKKRLHCYQNRSKCEGVSCYFLFWWDMRRIVCDDDEYSSLDFMHIDMIKKFLSKQPFHDASSYFSSILRNDEHYSWILLRANLPNIFSMPTFIHLCLLFYIFKINTCIKKINFMQLSTSCNWALHLTKDTANFHWKFSKWLSALCAKWFFFLCLLLFSFLVLNAYSNTKIFHHTGN